MHHKLITAAIFFLFLECLSNWKDLQNLGLQVYSSHINDGISVAGICFDFLIASKHLGGFGAVLELELDNYIYFQRALISI